jgi:hypothetical protein
MFIGSDSVLSPVHADGNLNSSGDAPEENFGLLAFARGLHAYRIQHDQKYRLEPARIRLEEERAVTARQTSAQEVAE